MNYSENNAFYASPLLGCVNKRSISRSEFKSRLKQNDINYMERLNFLKISVISRTPKLKKNPKIIQKKIEAKIILNI